MKFRTAFWQFQLLSFAFLCSMQALVPQNFVVGVGAGIIAMLCIDSFVDHYNEWARGMKKYKLSCGCVLTTNDPESATQYCRHGNKFVKN